MAGPWDRFKFAPKLATAAPAAEDAAVPGPVADVGADVGPWNSFSKDRPGAVGNIDTGVPVLPSPQPSPVPLGKTERRDRDYEKKFGSDASYRTDLARAYAQGILSWADEGIAAVRAIPEAVTTDRGYWDVYADKVADERKRYENVKEFDPESAWNSELAGIGTSLFVPALAVNKMVKGGMGLKKALGIAGAGAGANHGAGAKNVDGDATWGEAAAERGQAAVLPAAVGSVAGPVIGTLGEKVIGPAVAVTRKAIANVKDPANAVYSKMSTQLGDGGVDKLFDDIATTPVQKRTLGVLGEEMVKSGGDRAAAEAATIQRISGEFNVKPETVKANLGDLRGQVRNSRLFFAEYPAVSDAERLARTSRRKDLTPDEVSKIDDTDIHWNLDALANKGMGQSMRDTRNAIADRARSANAALSSDIQKMSPNGQTIEDVADLAANAERIAKAEYRMVHDPANALFDMPTLHRGIQDAVEKHKRAWASRAGVQKDALSAALKEFETELANGQRVVMPTSQQAQDMRGALRGIITQNVKEAKPHIVQVLQPLYDDVTKAMKAASPEWEKVNAKWADLSIKEVASDLGDAFSKKAGPRYREQKQEFDRLAPEVQDVVRVHLLQKFQDDLDNAVKMGNPAKFFNNNHTYKAIGEIFGPKAATDFARRTRDYNVEEMSKGMTKGSPTHRREQAQKLGDAEESLAAAAKTLDVKSWREWLFETAKGLMTERRDREMARIATTPVSDVAKTAEHVERMKRAPDVYRSIEGDPTRTGINWGTTAQRLGTRSATESQRDDQRLIEQRDERMRGQKFAGGGEVEHFVDDPISGSLPNAPYVHRTPRGYDPPRSTGPDAEREESVRRIREMIRKDREELRQHRPDLFDDKPPAAPLRDQGPGSSLPQHQHLGMGGDGLGADVWGSVGRSQQQSEPYIDLGGEVMQAAVPDQNAWRTFAEGGPVGGRSLGDDPDDFGYASTGVYDPPRDPGDEAARLPDNAKDIALLLGSLAIPGASIPAWGLRGLAGSYGLLNATPEANSTNDADLRELRRELERQSGPEADRLRTQLDAAIKRRSGLDEQLTTLQGMKAKANVKSTRDSISTAERSQTAANEEVSKLEELLNAETARVRGEAEERANSVMMARSGASTERDRIRSSQPKAFHQAYQDWQKEIPLLPPAAFLPYAAGAGAVAATKALPVASSWIGRGTASNLLRSGSADDLAHASDLASRHAGNPKMFSATDAGIGAIGGSTFGVLPLTYNALTQNEKNPDRIAADAYASGLLDIDPRKQQAKDMASAIPEDNPNYTPMNLDNAPRYLSNLGVSALEGGAAGKFVGLGMESMKPRFTNVQAAVKRGPRDPDAPTGSGGRRRPDETQSQDLGTADHQRVPTVFSQYSQLPPEWRGKIQDAYRFSRIENGADVPAKAAISIKDSLARSGVTVPVTPGRVKATNEAVNEFIAKNGRGPTSKADWDQIWSSKTLAVPASIGVGAGALSLGDTPAQAQVGSRGLGDPSIADEDLANVPDYVRRIRKNSAKQYIGDRGRYVPLTDAQIFERLRKKGLLGHYKAAAQERVAESLP